MPRPAGGSALDSRLETGRTDARDAPLVARATDLRERGFEDLEQGRARRIHTDADGRARLTPYAARFDAGAIEAGIAAWLAVWVHEGEFRIAGGAYPTSGLGSVRLEPDRYREELFALIHGVR